MRRLCSADQTKRERICANENNVRQKAYKRITLHAHTFAKYSGFTQTMRALRVLNVAERVQHLQRWCERRRLTRIWIGVRKPLLCGRVKLRLRRHDRKHAVV